MFPAVSESSGKFYTHTDSKVPFLDNQIQLVWTKARETVFFSQLPKC